MFNGKMYRRGVLSISLVLGALTSVAVPLGNTAGAASSAVPGVTAKSITVGNVSTLSGPVPGLFDGGPFGTEAYFAYVNAHGGVNGRKIEVDGDDDGYS